MLLFVWVGERLILRDKGVIEPLGGAKDSLRAQWIIIPFRNYILVSINGTNSPFPTTLQIFRSKAMIRPSFVSQKGVQCETVRLRCAESEVLEHTISAEPRGRVVC